MREGLVHHIIKIPPALSLPLLRGAAVGRAPTIFQNDWFCTRISNFFKSRIFSIARTHDGLCLNQFNTLLQHTTATHCYNTLRQHTTATHSCNTLLQHTTATHYSDCISLYCTTLLQHCDYCYTLLQHINEMRFHFMFLSSFT